MNRREFIGSGAALSAFGKERKARKKPEEDAIEQLTVAGVQDAFRSGRFTSHALTERFLRRIHKLDRTGPAVNAVIELNPDALKIAAALDRERKANKIRGPLHGVPVLIKDNIDTADRVATTAGSLALVENYAAEDSHVARRLRAAGAVILGKTNLSEWANFRSDHSTSGWSGRGGQTRNPYALDRNPCGSSSGTAAAVSAGFCIVGVGTETDGSVVCPASVNGLVGIKPTLGLISRAGIIPIAHSQDTAGPMARTVQDAAILLGVLAGVDPRDSATQAASAHIQDDYTVFLDAKGLRGARIGIARKFFGISATVDKAMEDCIGLMKREGAVIVDHADLPTHGKFDDFEHTVLQYEFKADLNKYLSRVPSGVAVHSLADVIDFNSKNRAREMPYFEQELLIYSEKKGPLTDQVYLDALRMAKDMAGRDGIDAVLASQNLDAIAAPTSGPAWVTDWISGDHDAGGCSQPAAVAGYPHITVPAGSAFGMPFGISFFGGAWSEPKLLKLAYAFEQAARMRRAPAFLSTANWNA
jgi:amidase